MSTVGHKSTQSAQTSLAKAAHYPHIARLPDLESQHGDLDHTKKINQLSPTSL